MTMLGFLCGLDHAILLHRRCRFFMIDAAILHHRFSLNCNRARRRFDGQYYQGKKQRKQLQIDRCSA